MARVHPSSFRPAHILAVLASMTALAGCMGGQTLLGEGPLLRLNTVEEAPRVEAAANAKAAPIAPATTSGAVTIAPAGSAPEASAWCDYLREDTAAQTTIMRAPSLRGSLADDGKASMSLGLSVTDFAKASLMEESAEVRCRRYLAENGLQKLVFLAPQGLTSAGHKAKLKAIESQRKEITRLRTKARRLMNDGIMDREMATSVDVLADQIFADASASKSQADRRTPEVLMPQATAKALGSELLQAESDIEDINSRMRMLDAMDVSVSAGWNDDVDTGGLATADQSFSGKVSFSLKLGAVNPQRYAHEEAAKQAKLKAIAQEGGALWQVAALRRAHERAIQGLEEQQQSLEAAIAKAEKLASMLASVSNPEFEPPLVQAKLQLIKLRADRAGVAGSIAEIRANMKKLNAG